MPALGNIGHIGNPGRTLDRSNMLVARNPGIVSEPYSSADDDRKLHTVVGYWLFGGGGAPIIIAVGNQGGGVSAW